MVYLLPLPLAFYFIVHAIGGAHGGVRAIGVLSYFVGRLHG